MVPFGDKLPPQILLRFLPNKNEQKEVINTSDILVINGNVAVDESILTGENLPQIKTPVDHKDLNAVYDKKKFKNHLIFAGTDIVSANSQNDKPVLGMVLNTGFLTTKGKLARTVLYSEENN